MRGGLMQPPDGMPPAQGPEQPAGPEPEGGPDSYFGGEEQATPEEQAMYQKAMDAIWGLIYSKEETSKDMLAAMETAGSDPAQIGVEAGKLGLPLMEMLDQNMEEQGVVMPESVRLEVGLGIVEEVLELAETAGLLPDDEDSIGVAVATAQDTMFSQYGRDMSERGMISPQAGQAMLKEMRGVASDHLGVPVETLKPPTGGGQRG